MKVDVSVAAQSVVAVRWAFRQHAATEVGVLVRAATEVGVLVRGPLIPRRLMHNSRILTPLGCQGRVHAVAVWSRCPSACRPGMVVIGRPDYRVL
jgi:hypothetical protein